MLVGSMITPHSVVSNILGLRLLHAGRTPKYYDSWNRLLKCAVNPRRGFLLSRVPLNVAWDNTEWWGASYLCWYSGRHSLDSLYSPLTLLSEPVLTQLMTFCTAVFRHLTSSGGKCNWYQVSIAFPSWGSKVPEYSSAKRHNLCQNWFWEQSKGRV